MLEVAAAIIRKDEKILICQRPANKDLGLLWEFPGGKIEAGETGEQAVIRECREELGVTLKINSFFMDVTHEYPNRTVHLSVYNCSLTDGEPVRLERRQIVYQQQYPRKLPDEHHRYADYAQGRLRTRPAHREQ